MVSPIPQPSPSKISIDNVKEGETVHQRFLLVNGRAGPRTEKHDGIITVIHNYFPQQQWPCIDSYFKALLHLVPGSNTFTFIFQNKQLEFNVNYAPLLQNIPLYLVIFLGKDSPENFDVPPQKNGQNTLEIAVEKLRMAGYILQAACAEQMYRNGMGRRTFRLDEAWLTDTVSSQDEGKMRQTAQVHIVRSNYSVAEIRDARRTQQRNLFTLIWQNTEQIPPFNTSCYMAALLLDSHWDPQNQVLLGHAALGGGITDRGLSIFDSHSIHTWPRSIEEIVPCMIDNLPTDINYVCNDAFESGNSWKALDKGIGIMMHTIVHSFISKDVPFGVTVSGYKNLSHTFMVKQPGAQLIPPTEEKGSQWRRTDMMRLRFHPVFHIPQDGPAAINNPEGPTISPLAGNRLQFSAPAGLSMIVLYVNNQYENHIEYLDRQPTMITLSLDEIAGYRRYGPNERLLVEATCANHTLKRMKIKPRQVGLRGINGNVIKADYYGGTWGSDIHSCVLYNEGHLKQLKEVQIYYSLYLKAVALVWQDGTCDTLGETGGNCSRFSVQNGEYIQGFRIRHGDFVDGLEIILSSGRLSGWTGGKGGTLVTVAAPQGYRLVGFYGAVGEFLHQIGTYYQPNQ